MSEKLNIWFKENFRIQILFWICYFLFEWLNTGAMYEDFHRSLVIIAIHIPLIILASYLHLYITIEKFLVRGKIIPTIIIIIISLIGFGLIRRYINYTFIYPKYLPIGLNVPLITWPKIFYESMQLHLVVSLFLALNVIKNFIYQQKLNDRFKQEKLEAEYHLLQSQVHPHFLFNTLNNLMSVSLKNPEQVPSLLQRLAGLLSYQLHESNRKMVSIKKEIDYLEDYIALEKIRYGERLDIQTNFAEWETTEDLFIPPMLLLPFVENAFKHGASQSEGQSWIQIRLNKVGHRLIFKVENSVSYDATTTESSKLGLQNLRRRLEILYPNKFFLQTLEEDSHFLATLKFDLEEYGY